MHCNIQSIRNKVDEINLLIDEMTLPPTVIAFTEHWLTYEEIPVINLSGYKLASCFCRRHFSHGGCSIYVREDLGFLELTQLKQKSKELTMECSAVQLLELKIVIVCIYTTSNINKVKKSEFLEALVELMEDTGDMCLECKFFICGDFNIDLNKESREKYLFLDLMKSYDLKPSITKSTRITKTGDTLLDNIFTNQVNPRSCIVEWGLSDHSAQHLEIDVEIVVKNYQEKRRNFSAKNIQRFRRKVLCSDFSRIYGDSDPERALGAFYQVLNWNIRETCPIATMKSGNKCSKGWLTTGIRTSCHRKRLLYEEKKLGFATEHYYKDYCRILRKVIVAAKIKYNSNTILTARNKQQAAWKIIKPHSEKSKTFIEEICLVPEPMKQTLNRLNEFMINACNEKFPTTNYTERRKDVMQTIYLEPACPSEIFNSIMSLNSNHSVGTDGIPVVLLKSVADVICKPLCHVLNGCMEAGVFPHVWKTAIIHPIYKKGQKQELQNYRPIAILSNLSKIFERILSNRLMGFLKRHNILTTNQNAYISNRNTERGIFQLISDVIGSLNASKSVAGVFLDLSRAFDSIDHRRLYSKLTDIGIRGGTLDLLMSYLNNRKQLVQMRDMKGLMHTSDVAAVTGGVPQGSILGPLLFIVYVNNLPLNVSRPIVLYADDTSVVCSGDGTEDLVATIKNSMIELKDWFDFNHLKLNIDKTELIPFTTAHRIEDLEIECQDGEKLVSKNNTKFLGIRLDYQLRWTNHIESIAPRVSGASFLLRSLRNKVALHVNIIAYYGYVYPILKYGVIFWGNSVKMGRVFLLQKRCVRAIFNLKQRNSCREFFKESNILTLPSMYIMECCMFVRKHQTFYAEMRREHCHNTRGRDLLLAPSTRYTILQKNVLHQTARIFNHLPEAIRNIPSHYRFKRELRQILIEGCFYSLDEYMSCYYSA